MNKKNICGIQYRSLGNNGVPTRRALTPVSAKIYSPTRFKTHLTQKKLPKKPHTNKSIEPELKILDHNMLIPLLNPSRKLRFKPLNIYSEIVKNDISQAQFRIQKALFNIKNLIKTNN